MIMVLAIVLLLFVGASTPAKARVREALLRAAPSERVVDVMVAPFPANPACWSSIALSVDEAGLEDPPPLATHAGYDATRAVVRRPDDVPVLVLSLDHVLESVYRSALSAGEGAA